jgi:hypothetical protein
VDLGTLASNDPIPDEFTAETTMTAWAEFTVAELRERAGDDAFQSAGQGIAGMDGPHEDEWSLYSTITLDDGQELETILHHRAGTPLSGDCTCPQAHGRAFCTHLVWVGLTHLGLDAPPGVELDAETAPTSELRPWLATLRQDQLIELIIEATGNDHAYRRRLFLQARQDSHQ